MSDEDKSERIEKYMSEQNRIIEAMSDRNTLSLDDVWEGAGVLMTLREVIFLPFRAMPTVMTIDSLHRMYEDMCRIFPRVYEIDVGWEGLFNSYGDGFVYFEAELFPSIECLRKQDKPVSPSPMAEFRKALEGYPGLELNEFQFRNNITERLANECLGKGLEWLEMKRRNEE